MSAGVNVLTLYGRLHLAASEAVADIDWKKRRSQAVDSTIKSVGRSLAKDGLKVTENQLRGPAMKAWVEEKTGVAATFTPLQKPTQLNCKGVGGAGISVGKSLMYGFLKNSDNNGAKAVGWLMQGAFVLQSISTATPIGAALEGAFFLSDVVNAVADKRVEAMTKALMETIDDLNIRRHEDFKAVEDDASDALNETEPTKLRGGGWRGSLFTRALQAKVEDPDLPVSVLYEVARPYFLWKFHYLSDCLLRIFIDAFCLKAWSNLFDDFSKRPGDNALWGEPSYKGFVDISARTRFANSAGPAAQSLLRACMSRIEEVANEFASAEAWLLAWTGGAKDSDGAGA